MAEILCDSKSITITVAGEEADALWTIWRTPPTIPYGGEDWVGVRYKNLSTNDKHNVCVMLRDATGNVIDASPEGCRGTAITPAYKVAAGEIKEFEVWAKGLDTGTHNLKVVVCREIAWI